MKLLLYCTKAKPYLWNNKAYKEYMKEQGIEEPDFIISKYKAAGFTCDLLNGKIVGECDFEVEEIKVDECEFHTDTLNEKNLLKKSCLSFHQAFNYLKKEVSGYIGLYGYAISIKNLHIFDKPKELREYTRYNPERDSMWGGWLYDEYFSIKNAPQNMMHVYDGEEEKVLISIRPEWLCKILNGEKTIEVRKKVLKEMQ